MGRAMAAGLVRAGVSGTDDLRLADALPQVASSAAAEAAGRVADAPTAAGADLVVLAVKPKDAEALLVKLRPAVRPDAVLLSVVAGLTLARLQAAVPGVPVARTMPNLAVRHGAGLIVIATSGVPAAREEALAGALSGLGAVIALPEGLFDAATGLAGCGPGFLALVCEGLEEGGVAAGLARPAARDMTRALLAGTASLLEGGVDPADLRQRVSSPGGATVEGVGVLERGAVRAHLADAVRAAARRSASLGARE